MRVIFGLCLSAFALMANATTIDVAVIEGSHAPQKFSFVLGDNREHIDLRTDNTYAAAFRDPSTKKEICRDGVYRTGLLLTLKPIEATDEDETALEIIGYVTNLKALVPGETLSCGTNYTPEFDTTDFSDKVVLKKNRPKVIVIDTKYTVLVTRR